MSIRETAIKFRDFARDLKNKMRLRTTFLAAKRRGDILKRIDGFERLFEMAKGATILDLGCYDGLIAYEFFRSGAKLIHGLDNDAYHLSTAARIFSQVNIPFKFSHADLRKPDAIPAALGEACLEKYDMVLLLGVYQHIYKSMSEQQRRAMVDNMLARVRSVFAVRIPKNAWPEFEKQFPAEQFELVEQIDQVGHVGEFRIYRRI